MLEKIPYVGTVKSLDSLMFNYKRFKYRLRRKECTFDRRQSTLKRDNLKMLLLNSDIGRITTIRIFLR